MGSTNTKSGEEQSKMKGGSGDVEPMDTTSQEQGQDVLNQQSEDHAESCQVITKPLKTSQLGNESFEISFSDSTSPTKMAPMGRMSLNGKSEKKLTKEELEAKLKAAEERRMSIEAERRQKAVVRLEDAAARRESLEASRKQSAEAQLEQKLSITEKNREVYLETVKEKDRKLEEAHTKVSAVDQEKREETAAEITQRQERARELRERQLGEKLERVVEHNEKVRAVAESKVREGHGGAENTSGEDFHEAREE